MSDNPTTAANGISIIWDAGGTLFDTYPAKVAACRAVVRAQGYEAPESWLLHLFRQTTAHALRTVSETFGLNLDVFEEKFEANYEALGPEVQAPFPYVEEVCGLVRGGGGQNFIVTHRGRASLEALLHTHHLSRYFADSITADDPYPRKPDPTSLLALIARHSLLPEHCLVVGDRDLDVIAGARAGLKTCFFTQGRAGTPPQADLVVSAFEQLYAWLQHQVST